MEKVLTFMKHLIGKDIDFFTIHDIKINETTHNLIIDFEIFDIEIFEEKFNKNYLERKDKNTPEIHTVEFLDKYGINYLVDNEKDDSAYDSFCGAIHDYAEPGSAMNNLFGIITQENIENVKFNNIIKFMLLDDDSKYSKYGPSINLNYMTKLLHDIYYYSNIKLNKNEMKNDILLMINDMMARYLTENPQYIDTLALITENAKKLLNLKNPQPENQSQQQK